MSLQVQERGQVRVITGTRQNLEQEKKKIKQLWVTLLTKACSFSRTVRRRSRIEAEALLFPFLPPWPISRFLATTGNLLGGGTKGGKRRGSVHKAPFLNCFYFLLRVSIVLSISLRMIILFCVINLSFWNMTGNRGKRGWWKSVCALLLAALWGPANSPCLTPSVSSYPGCGRIYIYIYIVLCNYSF